MHAPRILLKIIVIWTTKNVSKQGKQSKVTEQAIISEWQIRIYKKINEQNALHKINHDHQTITYY